MRVNHILLIFLLLIISSCQKDDRYETIDEAIEIDYQKQTNAFNLSEEQIPDHILGFVKTKTKNTFKVNIAKNRITLTDKLTDELGRETPLGTVLTNKVVQVYNENNTKYTFRVTNPQNAMSVINLVVVDTGENIIEYFIQYSFDPNYEVPLIDGGGVDMAAFTGGLTFYNESGDIIGTFILVHGQVIENAGRTSPCDDDDNTPPDDDDDNNEDDGPGGGGPSGSNDQDGNNDNGSGQGEFTDPDWGTDDTDCGFTFMYGNCGCGWEWANGHDETENDCCSGSPIIITDTCTGINTQYGRTTSREPIDDPCAGDVGMILDLEDYVIDLYFEEVDDKILDYLDDCRKQVLNDIKTLENGKISDILKKFTDRDTTSIGQYNWRVSEVYDSHSRLAKTSPMMEFMSGSYYAKTELNKNQISDATDLLVAQVLMHEAVHAYLVNYIRLNNAPFYLSEEFEDYEFHEMLAEYYELENSGSGEAFDIAQHNQFIRDNIVDNIAEALKEYGENKGYNLTETYYNNLAWAGLQETSAYDSLSNSRKSEIEFLILAEKTNTSNDEATPKGTQTCSN